MSSSGVPIDRADETAERLFWEIQNVSSFATRKLMIAAALRDCIAEERERCAKVLDQLYQEALDDNSGYEAETARAHKRGAARIREGDTKA